MLADMNKLLHFFAGLLLVLLGAGCSKIIDLAPESNVTVESFYKNYTEVNTALTGCYNGMQKPLETEWMMTELRCDVSKQGSPGSTAVANVELNDLNTYLLNSAHSQVYNYWFNTYKNIRSTNYVLRSLGVTYENGTTDFTADGTASVTAMERRQLAGEAAFIRAYHYFNLVRLFGGVFLLTDPQSPQALKQINRATPTQIYALVEADLKAASNWMVRRTNAQVPDAERGRATIWAAKALLAKLYLTTNRATEALPLLEEVLTQSGHAMLPSYASVFSTANEMNAEILFAVRFKSGGLGLGNFMANSFAALNSGSAIVNGNGRGLNYPTLHMESRYISPLTGAKDLRKDVNIQRFNVLSYVAKFISQVQVVNDAENDFPVIRYTDVMLMKAEALGFTPESISLINAVRARAGAVPYSGVGNFNAAFHLYPETGAEAITADNFLDRLLLERRLELAFENQRYFDLRRTGAFDAAMAVYYEAEYDEHYRRFRPALTLDQLNENHKIRPLLPIPQRELDTNNEIEIAQNPGY
jgi:hypothetical protein